MAKYVGIFILVFVFSPLKSQDYNFWSTGLSIEDIRQACKYASAYERSVVYLPAGEESHNDELLIIPPGISLIGEGIEKTIIENAHIIIDSSLKPGFTHKFFRISGLNLITDSHIEVRGCDDFRIDNCKIESIGGAAVDIKHSKNGLVDHCILDATNYGVFISNSLTDSFPFSWETDLISRMERNNAITIEDCAFYNYRNAAIGHGNAYFIVRFNTFNSGGKHPSYAVGAQGPGKISPTDSTNIGSRLLICYNNTFYAPDTTNNTHAISISGGAAFVFNNEFINWKNGIALTLEDNASQYDTSTFPRYIWIWDNTHSKYENWDTIAYVFYDTNIHDTMLPEYYIRMDQEYFLRHPSFENDGFDYVASAYPHQNSYKEIIDHVPSAIITNNSSNIPFCYPNPANSYLNVFISGFSVMELFSLQGIQLISSNSATMDISKLDNGHYILKIVDNRGNNYFEKIIVY